VIATGAAARITFTASRSHIRPCSLAIASTAPWQRSVSPSPSA
jgi:hypothetical protein